jgi:hypothetical protein
VQDLAAHLFKGLPAVLNREEMPIASALAFIQSSWKFDRVLSNSLLKLAVLQPTHSPLSFLDISDLMLSFSALRMVKLD